MEGRSSARRRDNCGIDDDDVSVVTETSPIVPLTRLVNCGQIDQLVSSEARISSALMTSRKQQTNMFTMVLDDVFDCNDNWAVHATVVEERV